MGGNKIITDEDLFSLKVSKLWRAFRSESFAFWMICVYLFFEYVRPQSILPFLDILPWAQLAVLGALIGCFFDKTVKWVSSFGNKLLITFLLIIIISSMSAYWPQVSYNNLDKLYSWIVIYFLIICIVNTRQRFFIFFLIFLLASFKISASLAMTWAGRSFTFTGWGLMGPPGFFQNSGELAIQMVVYWPVALALTVFLKPYLSKWMYVICMAMPITAWAVILGSSTRGGQLALFAQFVKKYFHRITRPKILIAIALGASVFWSFLPDEQKQRFSSMGEDKTSQQRLLYWQNGWEMMLDHPVVGVGYFNFIPYYETYYVDDMLYKNAQLPHNIFIQVGTDAGFLGLSIYTAIILYSFFVTRALGKEKSEMILMESKLATAFNYSLIGFVVAGQFVTVAYYPFLWIHLSMVTALKNIARKRTAHSNV
ncbi:O-antigen ligase family protein [Marinobacter sp.]|uniref:O-antigen ligase family protein n=1 Tax=Marinobacter sp. TaxID=50741 RepID=UPI00356A3CF3